jgi:hypothetical protein
MGIIFQLLPDLSRRVREEELLCINFWTFDYGPMARVALGGFLRNSVQVRKEADWYAYNIFWPP